jgi:hypothetical protein
VSYVQVELFVGSYSCPRAVADVFDGDTLTISSLDDESIIREFQPGDWVSVTVYDGSGHPLYTHNATTPPRELYPVAVLAGDPRRI